MVGEAWGSLPFCAVGSCAGIAAWGAAAADTGAGAGAAAVAGAAAGAAAAGAGAGAAAPPTASITAITLPSDTLSPTLTLISFSTPACEDGISIEALSDSTVIRLCSALMVSPGLASTSITATSEKSPMSGTFTSTGPPAAGAAAGAGA